MKTDGKVNKLQQDFISKKPRCYSWHDEASPQTLRRFP